MGPADPTQHPPEELKQQELRGPANVSPLFFSIVFSKQTH